MSNGSDVRDCAKDIGCNLVVWKIKGAKQYRGLVFVITVMVFKLLNAGIMQILKQNNSCVITKGYKL